MHPLCVAAFLGQESAERRKGEGEYHERQERGPVNATFLPVAFKPTACIWLAGYQQAKVHLASDASCCKAAYLEIQFLITVDISKNPAGSQHPMTKGGNERL